MKKTLSIFTILILTFIYSSSSFAGDDGKLNLKNKKNGSYEVKDCFEKVNRGIFAFNQVIDKIVFKPLAKGYRIFPQPVSYTHLTLPSIYSV